MPWAARGPWAPVAGRTQLVTFRGGHGVGGAFRALPEKFNLYKFGRHQLNLPEASMGGTGGVIASVRTASLLHHPMVFSIPCKQCVFHSSIVPSFPLPASYQVGETSSAALGQGTTGDNVLTQI